jgi:hypothetical protein
MLIDLSFKAQAARRVQRRAACRRRCGKSSTEPIAVGRHRVLPVLPRERGRPDVLSHFRERGERFALGEQGLTFVTG